MPLCPFCPPTGGVFVISNSCVEANKYVTAGSCYNKRSDAVPVPLLAAACHAVAPAHKGTLSTATRVVECRAAALLLAKALGLPDHASFRRLGQVQEKAGLSLEQMGDVVAKHVGVGCKETTFSAPPSAFLTPFHLLLPCPALTVQHGNYDLCVQLHEGDYSQDEMAAALDLSKEALQKEVLSPSTIDQEGFSLRLRYAAPLGAARRREPVLSLISNLPSPTALPLCIACSAQHVFKEASLVFAFKEAKTLPELGELMNKSHASCRDLYECSCPELDTLTQLCRCAWRRGVALCRRGN